ncbi:MAG: ABC transporter permease [Candidatus Poribacteria bacterium]|nr:ABC transporter permease [Candidatus Poribacteria bacterium]
MILKIAFRNIFRQKRRTILTALAMIVGFTLSSLFIGWSDGIYSNIISTFTRNRIGHIQVHTEGYRARPSIYKTISDYEPVGETIQDISGVEAWTPRIYAAGLGSVGEKSTAVQVVGVDVVRENDATQLYQKVIEGRLFTENTTHEAVIGKRLAKILKAEVGSDFVIFSQAADGSLANDLYKIVGITESGDDRTDRTTCYINLAAAQELFVLNGRIHEIVVIVSNINHVGKITNKMKESLTNATLEVAPWQEVAKSFYNAMKTDQQGDAIGRFVILFIVAMGVLNTVLMSVLERTREYGLLKAVGTTPLQIFYLVICEVGIIALASIIVGALFGTFFNYLLSVYGITLSEELTYGGMKFGTMHAEVNVRSILIPTITVFCSAMLVSLYPAIKAARILPAKAMRVH